MSLKNDLKHWIRDLFRYPTLKPQDESYDVYWESRGVNEGLNSFQKQRADIFLKYLREGEGVLDIGCGGGQMLTYLDGKKQLGRLIGVDSSAKALEVARRHLTHVFQVDIRNDGERNQLPKTDWVVLFEVLEHMPNSEDFLTWAIQQSKKGVAFSVPNTGFIGHRLRLLLGRFPLQWRAHPSEHLRFWTVQDMKWWLSQQKYANYELHLYKGFPLLNRIWPALFAEGILVVLKKV